MAANELDRDFIDMRSSQVEDLIDRAAELNPDPIIDGLSYWSMATDYLGGNPKNLMSRHIVTTGLKREKPAKQILIDILSRKEPPY